MERGLYFFLPFRHILALSTTRQMLIEWLRIFIRRPSSKQYELFDGTWAPWRRWRNRTRYQIFIFESHFWLFSKKEKKCNLRLLCLMVVYNKIVFQYFKGQMRTSGRAVSPWWRQHKKSYMSSTPRAFSHLGDGSGLLLLLGGRLMWSRLTVPNCENGIQN